VVVTIDTISCDSAAKAAAAGSTAEVYVKGYVTEIAYAWANGSMSFWMADTQDGGRVFEAYKCAIADKADAVNVGDLVIAHGNLAKYNTTYELAEGCTVEIIERAPAPENLGEKTIAEFLALKNTKDTCILTGVVDSIKSTTYGNLYLSDETAQVYIYGVLNAAGESKKFAELDVEAGDTLTVKAIYGEYNNAPQVSNAIFVSVAKAPVAPADTIEITITEGLEWEDATADEGWWQVMGQNETYFITLSNGNTVTEAAGTYAAADLDPGYSYVRLVNGTDKITFTDGSVTVTIDEESEAALIAGTLVGADGNVYVITLATSTAVDPYKYDEDEADFVYDFESYTLNDTYATSNGIVIVSGETDNTTITLYIILPQGQTELVAGEYAVSATPAYGTVIAGSYDDGIKPSVAATLVEYGGQLYYSEIWYLVSGTVTVDADLNITVDALNSKEKAIKATLKGPDTEAIDAVDAAANAVKALRDGQLIIEKNGQIFNVLGAQIR
ncbi:MAG: hypothetical protein IJ814_08070, partial [Paludibacteraceae bacterium]|nr:hypothetical protein [Paludibacteraceae bacterium]